MADTQDDKARRFRALHERKGAFVIPNPWDGGSARILASLGFEALATTSAGFAFSIGRRDGAVSRDATLANARAIVEATPLPVSADLENGYGDAPEDAAKTIRLAGGVGSGRRFDRGRDRRQGPADLRFHPCGRARDGRGRGGPRAPLRLHPDRPHENFLNGRHDLDDTIKRLQAFEKAGADVLYAPGLPDLDAIRAVCSAVSRPVNVVMGLKGATFSVEHSPPPA